MLKLGTKCIKNLKLGDKGIFKAMYNGKAVYRNHPIFLDYVESNGGAYINTELKPSYNYTVKIKYQYTNLNILYNPIFGMRTGAIGSGSGLFWAGMSNNTKEAYLRFGANAVNYPMGDKALDMIEMTCSPEGIFINGEDTGARYYNGDIASNALEMYLFTINPTTAELGETNAKVYSYEVYDGNNALVQNLRPCIDPCGVVCMYDMVTGKYFYNQGIGTFKAGGRFVESIIFDGNSWIDTGKYANQNIEINTTFKYNMVERAIYGVRDGNNNCTGYASVSGAWRFGSNMAHYRTEVNTIYNVVQNRQGIDINGQYTAYTDTTSEFTSSYTILLGKQNNTTFDPFKGEINVFRIKENGVAIQDLRPLVDENGVACFVDLVTGERFYNQGTGKLKYKDFERLPYLEFDGTNYIDTGYKPNSNSSVSATYYPYNSDAFTCIFGTQDTTVTNRFYAVISLTRYRLQVQSANTSGFWGVSSTGLVNSANGTFASTQQKVGLTIDNYNKQIRIKSNELTKTFDMATYNSSLGTVDCQYNLLLGNRNTTGVPSTSNAFKGKIHDFQIKESGELIRDYIPVKRSDGVKCMYDRVEGKYYELIGV